MDILKVLKFMDLLGNFERGCTVSCVDSSSGIEDLSDFLDDTMGIGKAIISKINFWHFSS